MIKAKHTDTDAQPPVSPASDTEKTAAVRRWAIEQAIILHGQHGATTDKVLAEADTILAFVNAVDKAIEAKEST